MRSKYFRFLFFFVLVKFKLAPYSASSVHIFFSFWMQFFAHLSIFSEKIKLAVHWKKMKRLRQSNLSNTCYKNCKETYILNARCVCVFFFWFEFYVRGSISLVSRWNSCNAHLVIFFSLNSPEFHENQLIFSFLNWILINANQFKRIIKIHFRELLSTEK